MKRALHEAWKKRRVKVVPLTARDVPRNPDEEEVRMERMEETCRGEKAGKDGLSSWEKCGALLEGQAPQQGRRGTVTPQQPALIARAGTLVHCRA